MSKVKPPTFSWPHLPPGVRPFSSTCTRKPWWARRAAAASPPTPAPMMATLWGARVMGAPSSAALGEVGQQAVEQGVGGALGSGEGGEGGEGAPRGAGDAVDEPLRGLAPSKLLNAVAGLLEIALILVGDSQRASSSRRPRSVARA